MSSDAVVIGTLRVNFKTLKSYSQILKCHLLQSSAAVVTGALRVNFKTLKSYSQILKWTHDISLEKTGIFNDFNKSDMPRHNEFQISLNQNNIEAVKVTKINCNHNYGRARGGSGMIIRVNLNFNNTTSQKFLNDFPSILTKGSIMTPLIKMCHATKCSLD